MTSSKHFTRSGKKILLRDRTEVIIPLLRKHQSNLGVCVSLGLMYLPVFSEHLRAITVDVGFSLICFYLFLIEEMHAEICYAECLLQKAALTFVQVMNLWLRVVLPGKPAGTPQQKCGSFCQCFISFDFL